MSRCLRGSPALLPLGLRAGRVLALGEELNGDLPLLDDLRPARPAHFAGLGVGREAEASVRGGVVLPANGDPLLAVQEVLPIDGRSAAASELDRFFGLEGHDALPSVVGPGAYLPPGRVTHVALPRYGSKSPLRGISRG